MSIFETSAEQYEDWFEKHPATYKSEINAIRNALPEGWRNMRGMEIGIGTGRFAIPFNIHEGVEPAVAMRKIAEAKNIHAVEGTAENLPFDKETFDFALMVTTICFVDDPDKSCKEAYRIIKPGGSLIIGIVNKNSELGQEYEARKQTSRFYKDATFFTVEDIIKLLSNSGFTDLKFQQTLTAHPNELTEPEQAIPGYDNGAFVAISGTRPNDKLSTVLQATDDITGRTLEERAKLVLMTLGRNPEEIKKAYRTLAQKHHPDAETGDTEIFQLINEAYILLTNGKISKTPLLANDELIIKTTKLDNLAPLFDKQKEWAKYEEERRNQFYGFGVI